MEAALVVVENDMSLAVGTSADEDDVTDNLLRTSPSPPPRRVCFSITASYEHMSHCPAPICKGSQPDAAVCGTKSPLSGSFQIFLIPSRG